MGIKPIVAIVGRPNVGKSTLFNRLSRQRSAIVSDIAGTTRDRVMTETVWADYAFVLVDTGGLDEFPDDVIWRQVRSQIDVAISEADVIIMLVDADAGVTAPDRDVAEVVRRTAKPVILAANKADNPNREAAAVEFYELGLGDPLPISAYHNLGIDDLMTEVIANFPPEPEFPEPEADVKIAIVGRTNAGKSMLLNRITGQERSIVSEIPGTTRDAIDTVIRYDDRSLLLIDTAGIRRRGSIEQGIEKYSVLRSVRAIDRADVVVLLLDATELATDQDTHIANFVLEAYKGIVIAVNKWDLAGSLNTSREEATKRVRDKFRFLSYAPVCFISALNGNGVEELLNSCLEIFNEWSKGVPRYDLRRTVMNAVALHPPATSGRTQLKLYSVAQDQSAPPTFTFYVNRSDLVHFSYQRYLENALRQAYGFRGSPIRMRFKGRRDNDDRQR
jgi:GTP-binding protein